MKCGASVPSEVNYRAKLTIVYFSRQGAHIIHELNNRYDSTICREKTFRPLTSMKQPEASLHGLLKQPQARIEAKTPHFHLSPMRLRSGQALSKGRENKRKTLNRRNPTISPFEKGRGNHSTPRGLKNGGTKEAGKKGNRHGSFSRRLRNDQLRYPGAGVDEQDRLDRRDLFVWRLISGWG